MLVVKYASPGTESSRQVGEAVRILYRSYLLLFVEQSDGQFHEDYSKILQPEDAQYRYMDDDVTTCRTLNNFYELDLKDWYRVKAVSYLPSSLYHFLL